MEIDRLRQGCLAATYCEARNTRHIAKTIWVLQRWKTITKMTRMS